MPQYLLVLRDNGFPDGISPEEIQAIIERYGVWMQKVRSTAGNKLRDAEGRVIRRNGTKTTVTDGPFAEAKEVLGGYFLVDAASYDDAVKMCGDCPHLEFGSIEVREVEPT
jgi:hypothetical protein